MKLIKWNTVENIEAYTITKDLDDMSYNNEDKQLILNNRKQLAKLLKTDLEHITFKTFTIHFNCINTNMD